MIRNGLKKQQNAWKYHLETRSPTSFSLWVVHILNDSRPCKRCGRMPTKEGYDACLGYIKGAKSACCGHGIEKPYILKNK